MSEGGHTRRTRQSGSAPGWLSDVLQDRARLLFVAAVTALALFFGGVGAAVGAWSQACAGGCPTASEIEHFAPRQASELY
ncbi:MAG TPA: hypothetical protein VMN39_02870, partial [Longimicrobiaceae bacterium]|nr:hypothetical protein [Longimicrobiaceae bacterium]